MKNFKEMVLPRPTRQNEEPNYNCSCYICLTGSNITRKPAYQKKTYDGNIEKGHGLFGCGENKLPNVNNLDEHKQVINICSKCKQEVGRGKTHKCSFSSTSFNIISQIEDLPRKQKDQIASELLFQKTGGKDHKTVQLDLHTKGSKLRVTLNPEKEKERVELTHSALDSLSLDLGLSNTKVKKVNQFIRTQFGRESVQPYHRSHLTERGNHLFELYKFENISFTDSSNNPIDRCLVFADAEDIIDRICDFRGYDYPGLVKVMIDGGKGFLKICLSVLPPDSLPL